MRKKETNKQNEFNTHEDGHQHVRVLVGTSNNNGGRGRDSSNLQIVSSKNGRQGVRSPTRKGKLTVSSSPRTSPNRLNNNKVNNNKLHLSKNKKGTTRLHSPKRDGKLTLSSGSLRSPRGRQVHRERQNSYDVEKKKKIVGPVRSSTLSPLPSKRDQKNNAATTNSKKSEGVVLHCPSNYDDDVSSISDGNLHSIGRSREMGRARGEDFAFSIPGRSYTTGDIMGEEHERGQEFALKHRSRTISAVNPAEGMDALDEEKSEDDDDDDSISIPWERKEKQGVGINPKYTTTAVDGNDNNDEDDDGMIALLSPLQLVEQKYSNSPKPSCQKSVGVSLSTTSTRGQDEALMMPETPGFVLGS